jgi:hypothetical protein
MRDKMKRRDLLNLIERAIESEDKIAEGMTKDIASALEWCGCSEKNRLEVKRALLTISSESGDHSSMLGDLRKIVSESTKKSF